MFAIPRDLLDYKYLVFLILHKSNAKTGGVDHWTVLVVDYLNRDFNLYNLMLSRRKILDPYLCDAKELVRYILN